MMPELKKVSHKIDVINACFGWGAQIRETEFGPHSLEAHGTFERLRAMGFPFNQDFPLIPSLSSKGAAPLRGKETLPLLLEFHSALATNVMATVKSGNLPLVIGGDHSIAIGTWSGVAVANKCCGNMGLLWIDAHMDAHVPETSPSQAYHGMPVAHLLGWGENSLKNLVSDEPKISAPHLVLFGIRDYEPEERDFLTALEVRVYYMEEIRERGVEVCFKEAIQQISTGTAGFGVSLDLDAFDPQEAPGVGSPAPGGLSIEHMIPAFMSLRDRKDLLGFEITEYNPERDQDHKTADLMEAVLGAVFLKEL